jgi:DNA-binding NarL/FixJ family response regulator
MTDKEYDSYLARQAEQAEVEAEAQAKIEARQSALAKLAALGLTEEEIAAL